MNVMTIKIKLVKINNFNILVYKKATGVGFITALKQAPLVNDGIIKVKIPFLSKESDSLNTFKGSSELNLIITSLNNRALYKTVKNTLKIISTITPKCIVAWQFNSIIGSLEKKAAVKGAPHSLKLANIKVELFKGDLNIIPPLFFIA